MKSNHHILNHQLQILSRAVSVCEAKRNELTELQAQLADHDRTKTKRLDEIQKQHSLRQQQELQRLQMQAQQERETLQLDLQQESDSFLAQKKQTQLHQTSELTEETSRLAEQEKNELWVLQSVLDEDAADSPTDQLERERENFHLQKTTIEQRADVLQQQITRSRLFLDECHTTAEVQSPPPQPFVADGRDLADVIRESGDQLLAQAAEMESLYLPQWIRGSRRWLLALSVIVLVFFPVLLLRVSPQTLLNPDLAPINWQWIIISALCGFAAAACTAVFCMMSVQNHLRSGFQNMQQHASNHQSLAVLWEERSEQRLQKLAHAAKKWQKKVTRQRERKTASIQERFAGQRAILEQQIVQLQLKFDADVKLHETSLQHHQATELERIDQRDRNSRQQLEQTTDKQCKQDRMACASDFDRLAQATRATADQLVEEWNQQLTTVRELTLESTRFDSTHRWPAVPDGEWNAPEQMPDAMSPGDLLVTLPKSPDSAVQPSTTNLCLEMPAVLVFPNDTSILVEHDAAGRETALSFLRTQILRLLTLIPPGQIRLTLIDPIGLGQSFSAMMHLADYDELLINSRIWTDESQIRNQLRKTTEHMENVFQTYLRSEFSTIEEYNASAEEVAEPYHFVVVAGFPQAFSEEAARHLSSVLTSGPSCGVHALIAWNPELTCPPGFDVGELQSNCIPFRVLNRTVVPAIDFPAALEFESVPEPTAEDSVTIVKAVGEKSKDARRVEVSFRHVAPRTKSIWNQSTAESIDLPIGRAGAARLQFMRLGRGTSQHVLVAGKTGSGKSTFLHIVITNLALHYSPSEIQFYLIDFKKGVEFRTYAANRLPHVRVVAIESDREFGLSVLECLDAVMQERGELFRSRGVQDVPSFRKQFPDEPMPRLLLLIDEFQEFFVAEDRVASRASLLLDRLVRQGRAFGVHVMLGSQTLGGAYSLARSTMGQVAVRIALQCSESDAHLILSEDNGAARLLTRPGEAIYNDANGLIEGNHPFQIAWLEEEVREEMINQLKQRTDIPTPESSMIVFEGNVAPTVEQCDPLRGTFQTLPDVSPPRFETKPLWLGEPVAIAAPTHVELRRAGGQNLLLVGQDETLIDSMLGLIVLSACAGADSNTAVTFLHNEQNKEAAQRFKQLTASGAVPGCELQTPESCVRVIDEMSVELKRREELTDRTNVSEILLVVRDIGQFRELRRDHDDFSLGSFGEAKPESPASMFDDLIRRGPLVGIHAVVWADSFNNAMRWMSTSLLREFENRIALRMNQTDSASLVDSPVAASLGPGRALLYRDQTGAVEKFRPFAWPSAEWLSEVVRWQDGQTRTELDIESLRIE